MRQNKFIIVQVYLEQSTDEGMSRMQRNRFTKAQEIFRGETNGKLGCDGQETPTKNHATNKKYLKTKRTKHENVKKAKIRK